MNVIGFDDGPFARDHRGDVFLAGVVCSDTRVDGVVSGRVRRDGTNSTRAMIEVVRRSQFGPGLQAVLLQGIAVAGFNVIDVHALRDALGVPVLVVTRRRPDMAAVRRALLSDAPAIRPPVAGAARKWALIEAAGPMEPLTASRRAMLRAAGSNDAPHPRPLWVQRVGLTMERARALVECTTLHGSLPEPLRIAHLVAGGVVTGSSRGRA
jgi:endonuclease V-like protein UPF0215 family